MASRYCGNCGHELSPDNRFCPNCGGAVHETARVSTPEADVSVPPPPPTQQMAAQPQARTRRGAYLVGGVAAVAALVVLVIGLTALGRVGEGDEQAARAPAPTSEEPTTAPTPEEPTTASTPEEQEQQQEPQPSPSDPISQIGDIVSVGDVSWQVTDAQQTTVLTSQFGEFGSPKQGNFVIVDFLFTNNGNEAVTLDPISLTLIDGQGREFEPDTDTFEYIPEEKDIFLNQVNPGVSHEGMVIFTVAPDASDFTLQVGDAKLFGNETASIELDMSESTATPTGDNGLEVSAEVLEAQARQAAEEYYRALGLQDWGYTYDHLDSVTQSMFTEEEWFEKNQYYWDLNPTVYHILSVELLDDPEETITEVTVRVTAADGTSFIRTTYWVLENGEWLHRFGPEEISTFMPGVPF